MKIFLHGKFAQDYGSEHVIKAETITEAVDALTRQLKFYDDLLLDDRPVVTIVDHDTVESLNECPEEIHLVPAVFGGKGGLGKVLIGAAFIGLALTGVGGIAAIALAKTTLGAIMLSVGVGLVLSGISQMFIKAPSLSKDSDPEASKYLGLSNNTTKMGTLRGYSMGRIKVTAPHLLALNVDSTDLVKGEFPE